MVLLTILECVARAEESVAILPGDMKLTGPHAQQTLLVEKVNDGQYVGEAGGSQEWSFGDPSVATIEEGVLVPRKNGETTLTLKSGEQTATAKVRVERFDEASPVSFRNHVQSVLAKAGCNSGACHGALAGKNGLKLSLHGYDANADWFMITRQARGRRIVPDDPARSLFVTKPTAAIPHKGGVRFDVGSPEYHTLVRWVAEGAQSPKADDPRLEKLEMLPGKLLLKPGMKQRILVRAHFSDGHVEDVTRWVKFTSSDESVALIDQTGRLTVMGEGEGFVSGWYLSQNVVATVTAPYQRPVDPKVFADAPRQNFIDEQVLKQLERLNLAPSPPAGDEEFLRRVYVDTIGTLPTAAEARAFYADSSPDKRNTLIESLLERPEFTDYWTYKWSDLLLVNSEKLNPTAMWAYHRWIRQQVAQNTPWDEFVRGIITAKGSTLENGAANFFVLHPDAADLAETTSQAFLGMSIGCAKCHNHPLEKWTNDQYYGMANLYSRVKVKSAGGEGNAFVFAVDRGELLQPNKGQAQLPRPLDADPVPFEATGDRREYLADWLVSPDNPYFARAITNRIWANYLNVGLVEAVDDLRLTNPASNEELLNAAAHFLVENKYDVKALMRAILQSATYQRSSRALPENEVDRRYYSRYYARRLMAEVLLDGISQVSGVPTQFYRESGDRRNRNIGGLGEPYPSDLRAIQLPDANVLSYFLKSFGRAPRHLTCECERTDEPSMVQVLHLSNGDTINEKLAAKGNRIEQSISAGMSNERIVEDAYLSTLARFPTAGEKDRLVQALGETPADERRVVLEDLYWSLLSSKEFLLNH
ncbi:MAG: DUF1549 and DUF1553 domain-containing protein [Pirellulales bacterium]